MMFLVPRPLPFRRGRRCVDHAWARAKPRRHRRETNHGRHAHRDRHLRPRRGGVRRLLGRPVAALAGQLQDRLGEAADPGGPGAGGREARRGGGQHGAGPARPADRRHHRGRRPGGDRRQAGRALPPGGMADRLGHPVEHERQRGDLQPRHRDAGRRDGEQETGPPQRPRQYEPVVQRHLSHRHAHRGGRRGRARPAAGARPPA